MSGGNVLERVSDRPQFFCVAALAGAAIILRIDGAAVHAVSGQSLLAVLLLNGSIARRSEVAGEACAGFCLMGACQDCWVWTEAGERLRACTTSAAAGMAILTAPPVFKSAS
jgi:predicted molibdopterin-dependent oxidoreductase YjgC